MEPPGFRPDEPWPTEVAVQDALGLSAEVIPRFGCSRSVTIPVVTKGRPLAGEPLGEVGHLSAVKRPSDPEEEPFSDRVADN